MNMFKRLPYFVYLQGRKIKINVDYRIMVSFEKVILDKSLSKDKKIQKIMKILCRFYPFFFSQNYHELMTNEELYKESIDKLIWIYRCRKERLS